MKTKNKYYLSVTMNTDRNASSKAVNDCNTILKKNGYSEYHLNIVNQGNRYLRKIHNYLQLKRIEKIERDSLLIVPHPIYINKKYLDVLKHAKQKKNLTVIFLIHDLESIRNLFVEIQDDFIQMDNNMYSIADGIIAHNDSMKNYLVSHGVKAPIYTLKIFDYLCEENKSVKIKENCLSIAGNLDTKKSTYIKEIAKLKTNTQFLLYGANFDESLNDTPNIQYFGSFPADEIPQQFNKGFGLIWDGTSIDECAGNTGNYLRYNNPHKLSLYLAAGLPVAVWSQSAEASFVRENECGVLIDSLADFDKKYEELSTTQYQKMVENCKRISIDLRSGRYLSEVVHSLEATICSIFNESSFSRKVPLK